MEFLQDIPWGSALLVLGGLCAVGVVFLVVLQVLSGVFGFMFNFLDIFVDLLTGGPLSACGCALGLVACGGCACFAAFGVSVLSTCGTPEAVNFCLLLGR